MRFISVSVFFLLLTVLGCQPSFQNYNQTIDLSGTWKFQLDSANMGIKEKWFNAALNDSLKLPGTADENKKGIFLDEKAIDRLSRVWYWKGAAWYQKRLKSRKDDLEKMSDSCLSGRRKHRFGMMIFILFGNRLF
jgi:hypothetical protein